MKVVLHNIRSTYNVGAILRTAEGLGVGEVVLSGYTPRYNDKKLLPHLREKLNHQITKSALGAEELVAQEQVDDLSTWLEEKKAQGWVIWGLENNLGEDEEQRKIVLGTQFDCLAFWETRRSIPSSRVSRATCSAAASALSQKVDNQTDHAGNNLVLILGEEVDGIPAQIREYCDYFLEIPMKGRKESFNVSVAAAIAMWELSKV